MLYISEDKLDVSRNTIRGIEFTLFLEEYDLTEKQARRYLQDNSLNTCDKCSVIKMSKNLVWITGPDFQPKEGEQVPEKAYKSYDALCEKCYQKVVQ